MTVGELREALEKWDSNLEVRIQVGEEFQEFSDRNIYMNDFGRIAIDSGCSDMGDELDELREEVDDLEYDVTERDGVIDLAGETAQDLKDLLEESQEPNMNEVRRLTKLLLDILK